MRSARVMLVAVVLATTAAGCRAQAAESGPITRQITIHYTHFDPSQLTVPHGVPVTFVLVNQDPIEHEWLIGDAAFHERHRHGTEAHHGARPNEVSIPALRTMRTTLTFDQPGTLLYVCHLPGHEAYGMVGTLTVT
ncbi:MAG TPA: cupredoxin domain-containing protein [Candidatus Limnocylindria bacterium]|nr:cupredoxin domain-containing protein [Candidatus Limnocylindria bacterium]